MKRSTVKTIRYALNLLKDINVSIAMRTGSCSRFELAKSDISKDDEAILDFEEFVKKNGFEEV